MKCLSEVVAVDPSILARVCEDLFALNNLSPLKLYISVYLYFFSIVHHYKKLRN